MYQALNPSRKTVHPCVKKYYEARNSTLYFMEEENTSSLGTRGKP